MTARPEVIAIMWPTNSYFWEVGPTAKLPRHLWADLGYETRFRNLSAGQCGGAINQERLIAIHHRISTRRTWKWLPLESDEGGTRPMQNLLTPDGLLGVPRRYLSTQKEQQIYLQGISVPDALRQSMPDRPGSWIQTGTGIRPLRMEEYHRGLGIATTLPSTVQLQGVTSLFLWEYVATVWTEFLRSDEQGEERTNESTREAPLKQPKLSETGKKDTPAFHWTPPDLSPGGAWRTQRVCNLRRAVATLPPEDQASCLQQGKRILEIHRGNYSSTGAAPSQLQIIWWEFPEEHWTDLREGSRMNFQIPPPSIIHPNAEMNPEQTQVAAEFVDELISLKVVGTSTEGRKTYGVNQKIKWAMAARSQSKLDQVKAAVAEELGIKEVLNVDTILVDTSIPATLPNLVRDTRSVVTTAGPFWQYGNSVVECCAKFILTTAPLFVIPKEGQPGQWRVISDMLRGGQNDCITPDPVFLPRTSHILDRMYSGGYSAVVDASKFFYQFPTHPDDQPYLGLRHPITDVLLTYKGLPMGAGNSPALAGRYGLAFVRKLREHCRLFRGTPTVNSWWTGFEETGMYDPDKGYGFIFRDPDNPDDLAVLIWVHVDDFLIHGPDYDRTSRALTAFLDLALSCGLLCHPKKLTPPQQVVKYCGFLLDSQATPCLRIPLTKRERALAMVDHLVEGDDPIDPFPVWLWQW